MHKIHSGSKEECLILRYDTFFWYLIYMLPILMYAIYLLHGSESANVMTFLDFVDTNHFTVIDTNVIYTSLQDVFGADGVFPVVGTSAFVICSWFVAMMLLHIVVDFLLFLPRVVHNAMDKLTK